MHLSPATEAKTATATPEAKNIEMHGGGHLRMGGSFSQYKQENIMANPGGDSFTDGFGDLRLKGTLQPSSRVRLEAHYENILSGGDTTRRSRLGFPEINGSLPASPFNPLGPITDERRLLDLTAVIDQGPGWIWVHRLDRLNVTFLPDWGTVRIGRQALTWGNGLIFNPLDLFNPFAPTDVYREYKTGDDMALLQVNLPSSAGVQLVVAPRRDPQTGKVAWSQSSAGGKVHVAFGTMEFDFLGAQHYGDTVLGVEGAGYLGEAAWRADASYTFLEHSSDPKQGYLSLVANMDYSWVWQGKNLYGLVEFFYNGLGENNYTRSLLDPAVTDRIARGEIFTLGRTYLAASVKIELHPLFSVTLTAINNLHDPSGMLQPRALWSVTQNTELTLGANLPYGGHGSEYGGLPLPGTSLETGPPAQFYTWIAYYF